MSKNNWILLLFVLQIFSFLLIPFFDGFGIVALLITFIISLFVVLISESWMKYFYPVFAMSCYIIIMRLFWLNELILLKELVFYFSGIGASLWCVILSIRIGLKRILYCFN